MGFVHDGGVGIYTLPSRTIQRRTTTNLKTKNNQNCQKVKLYGSLTTKELKKKHSLRLIGEVETGSQGGEDVCKVVASRPGWAGQWLADQVVPHLCEDKPGGTTEEQDLPHNPGFKCWKRKPQNLQL